MRRGSVPDQRMAGDASPAASPLNEVEQALTPAQRRALRAYCRHGNYRAAAAELGCAEVTVQGHIRDAKERVGADGLLDLLARLTWLQIPAA